MSTLDLRPLSVGISALPQLLVLALQLVQVALTPTRVGVARPTTEQFQAASPFLTSTGVAGIIVLAVVGIIVYFIAYLFAQGATVYAVSELYLGRPTTIGQSLSRVRGELGSLFGVIVLNGLVTGLCFLFLILLLYIVILYAALFLFNIPFGIGMASAAHDPAMLRVWTALMQVGNFVATVLVTPVFTIAASIFYFDLRVRKEGFDLQLMMNPQAAGVPAPRAAT